MRNDLEQNKHKRRKEENLANKVVNVLKLLDTTMEPSMVPTHRLQIWDEGPNEGDQEVDGLLQVVEGLGRKLGGSSWLPSSEGSVSHPFFLWKRVWHRENFFLNGR